MSNPLVTVYVPTKDRAAFLVRAVASVLGQTYKNIELIIVNDGSSDRTKDIVQSIQASDCRVRLINNLDPCGAPVARNQAIWAANGSYITGLDDDDYFLSTRISRLLRSYDRRYSFFCTNYLNLAPSAFKRTSLIGREIKQSNLAVRNCVGNQVFLPTTSVREVGGFDETLAACQDYDLWIRLVEKFGRGRRINNASYVVDCITPRKKISNDKFRSGAYDKFCEKHAELIRAGYREVIDQHKSLAPAKSVRKFYFSKEIKISSKLELFRQRLKFG